MNSWEDVPWRGGRAGGYLRRPLEGEPVKGSSSKSVRGPPPLWGLGGDSDTSLKSHIWSGFLLGRSNLDFVMIQNNIGQAGLKETPGLKGSTHFG